MCVKCDLGHPEACDNRRPSTEPSDLCVVCGAGPTGRCEPPDDYEGECPHGCSPER